MQTTSLKCGSCLARIAIAASKKSPPNFTATNVGRTLREHAKFSQCCGKLQSGFNFCCSELPGMSFILTPGRINSICSKGKGSVPRGRVYAFYASRCATEKITVLNPASFGKLVRVLFPGLKTRRLGVRGESKYHYVNFELLDDHPDVRATPLRSQTPSGPQPAVIRPQIMK